MSDYAHLLKYEDVSSFLLVIPVYKKTITLFQVSEKYFVTIKVTNMSSLGFSYRPFVLIVALE
jgi:hypothetical protein